MQTMMGSQKHAVHPTVWPSLEHEEEMFLENVGGQTPEQVQQSQVKRDCECPAILSHQGLAQGTAR